MTDGQMNRQDILWLLQRSAVKKYSDYSKMKVDNAVATVDKMMMRR